MDNCLLNFAGRLGRCWTELMRPLPKTIATLVLTITVILLACVGLGFLAFGLADGGHIPAENKGAGLAISGACAFTIAIIFSILWFYKLHSKRRNYTAAVPLREQSRTAVNDATFIEVISEQDSAEVRTPISTEASASPEVLSISCVMEPRDATCNQLAEVEVHHEGLQRVDSDSDKAFQEQVACPQGNNGKVEPASAGEQAAPLQEQKVECSQGNKPEEESASADEQTELKSSQQQMKSSNISLII